MSEAKHTPGPWGFRLEAPRTVIFHKAEIGERALAVGAGHYPAHIANARLIAAAPDLLEACEELLQDILSPFPREAVVIAGLGTGNSSIEKARAAIAKAKGGA
jgi:hypothetical protein